MNSELSKYMKEIGKRGGDTTKQRGVAHYQAIGRAGALKRWGDKRCRTCDGLFPHRKVRRTHGGTWVCDGCVSAKVAH